MSWSAAIALILCWLALIALARSRGPRDDPASMFAWRLARFIAFVQHRMRVEGREHLPARDGAGPLIVVANHTAGIDPLLIQAAAPFFVRFVIARDMTIPALAGIWAFAEVIVVDRTGRDRVGPREAIRHLRAGGVIGIFPEGGIERPPRTLRPFQPGVGLLVRRSGAPVLPIIIEGTPEAASAWGSFARRGRVRLRVMPPIDYRGTALDAPGIARDLQQRFRDWTGWPVRGG